jgi:hypothetical protein
MDMSDQSTLAVSIADLVDKRAVIAPFWDFLHWTQPGGMRIPANSPDTSYAFEFDPAPYVPQFARWIRSSTLAIHGAGLHMHYLGKSGSIRVHHPDSSYACVLEIPRWDFHWQTAYLLDSPVTFILNKDRISLECHWDNTAGHQPVIGGQLQAPRDVEWGPTSRDEMCIGYVFLTEQ